MPSLSLILSIVKSPISNYKTLASIYKIFETVITDTQYEPTDIVSARFTIAENIINSSIQNKETKVKDAVLEEYRKQDDDLRAVSYKLLVESFNSKYKNLNDDQKSLLREYINNVTNSEKLKKYIILETKKLQTDLLKTTTQIASKVVRIKIKEVAKLLSNLSKKHIVEDKDVLTILRYHELINEIKKTGKS